jgi:hypothetical protein
MAVVKIAHIAPNILLLYIQSNPCHYWRPDRGKREQLNTSCHSEKEELANSLSGLFRTSED